ncbi:MAG: hypothetical protein ACI915_005051 [Gammaproteobacteria bacterium]|jgi:hypothetical protein
MRIDKLDRCQEPDLLIRWGEFLVVQWHRHFSSRNGSTIDFGRRPTIATHRIFDVKLGESDVNAPHTWGDRR